MYVIFVLQFLNILFFFSFFLILAWVSIFLQAYLFFLVMSFVDSPSKKFFISVTPFHFNACPFDTFLRDFFFYSPAGLDGKASAYNARDLGGEDLLEKEIATHSSTLAWKIPWTEEPGRLQSMGSQRDTTEQLHFLSFKRFCLSACIIHLCVLCLFH